MRRKAIPVVLTTLIFLIFVSCSNNSEVDTDTRWWLDAETIPEWAQVGNFRCARWDGGPLEADKGRLSGWPYWAEGDSAGVLRAVESFYGLKTIEWAKRAGLNWLWVTWSVGFSHETEQKQWDILRPYIKECHKNGIKVTAYMSGANMFHEDMEEHVPGSTEWWQLDKNGEPVPYGAARYNKYGITRYMANMQHPDWLPYQRVRIREALEAGIDGFWIDNIGTKKYETEIRQLVDLIMEEGKKLDKIPLVCFNMHRGALAVARYTNCLSTEDGNEPGYYEAASTFGTDKTLFDAHEYDYAEETGKLVCNIGILKYQYAVSEGWRPSCVEYGKRHNGVSRMVDVMAPEKWQLSLAECQMHHNSLEPYFEGIFMRDLVEGNPYAHKCLDAMGVYNKFFDTHSEYLTNPTSIAKIGVLSQSRGGKPERKLISFLNKLSAQNVQYDVLLDVDLNNKLLSNYDVIVLPELIQIDTTKVEFVRNWISSGGKLLTYGKMEQRSDLFQCQFENEKADIGTGSVEFTEIVTKAEPLSKKLEGLVNDDELISLNAPPYVLHHAVLQKEKSRLVVHVLNYSQTETQGIELVCRAPVKNARLFSPDFEKSMSLESISGNNENIIEIPKMKTYCIIVINL
ncbi:hypothetical protein GF337_12255 [candidate division KSB1 bacterium]|nr:hypothetical protein [candidate division KSB1 bacterium]